MIAVWRSVAMGQSLRRALFHSKYSATEVVLDVIYVALQKWDVYCVRVHFGATALRLRLTLSLPIVGWNEAGASGGAGEVDRPRMGTVITWVINLTICRTGRPKNLSCIVVDCNAKKSESDGDAKGPPGSAQNSGPCLAWLAKLVNCAC